MPEKQEPTRKIQRTAIKKTSKRQESTVTITSKRADTDQQKIT
jgi:hypothetical protein